MPLTGSDSALAGAMASAFRAALTAKSSRVTAKINAGNTTAQAVAGEPDDITIMSAAFATAIVTHIVANAVVSNGTLVAHVTTQSLGVTPNPNNATTAIVQPASPVDIPLQGAGSIT